MRDLFFGSLFIMLLSFLLAACQNGENTRLPASGKADITSESLATSQPRFESATRSNEQVGSVSVYTAIIPETPTTIPTARPTESHQISLTPSPTGLTVTSLTPAASATPTMSTNLTATYIAASDPIDRTCPDNPPAKPDYNHYYLSAEQWLQPDNSGEAHLWFGKPLTGGGRLLYTDWLPYGYDAGGRYLIHNGLDSAEPEGSPIIAAADGMIVVAGDDMTKLYGWRCDWYGHLVVIEADQKWRGQTVYLVYGHVLNIEVEAGQRITRGQKIAEVGVGGAAKLPHLHFEIRVGSNEFGSTRNPLLWLEPPSTRGLIAGRLVDPEGRPWQGVAVAAVGRSDGTETHTTWTYLDDPQHLINGDEVLAENFVFGDLRPGEYELYVELQGTVYTLMVTVEPGELTVAEIVTEAYKTATPMPPAEAEAEETPTS
jgi:murein DD-endopeptidase MepM/ murein hydrolase activator NlpD